MTTAHLMTNILNLLESAAFITGLLYWKKIKNTIWVWFVVYLGFIAVSELTLNFMHYFINNGKQVNKIIEYISLPVEFLFLYWLYFKHANSKKGKLLVIACTVIYLAGFIADQYFFQGKKFIFDSVSYCIGNLVLLVVILSFFIQFSKSNDLLHYQSSMIFWVSLGALVFYLGTLPYFGLIHLLYEKYSTVFKYYTYLMFALDWVMYLLFIIGFIKWKPK